jgi:ABC-type phosphate transport system substrate-binding protein
VRFVADGRGPGATEFDTFQLLVLGVPDPTLAAMRPDYREYEREEQVRTAVADRPPGAAGIFRFTYYQQFEEQLRPLEIDAGDGAGCIFPSPETITTDLYPLSRSFHLFTTDRSLERIEAQRFLSSYLKQAPALAEDAELIPVPETLEAIQDQRVADPEAPIQ